eukprot:1826296-Rhodomonas_salina.1
MEEMVCRPNDHDSTEPLAPDTVMSTQVRHLSPDGSSGATFTTASVRFSIQGMHRSGRIFPNAKL